MALCNWCVHRETCYGEETEGNEVCVHFRRYDYKPISFFNKKYHCKDCDWLGEEKKSIGYRCGNKNRKMRESRWGTNEYKYPSCPACKTGFKLKEK